MDSEVVPSTDSKQLAWRKTRAALGQRSAAVDGFVKFVSSRPSGTEKCFDHKVSRLQGSPRHLVHDFDGDLCQVLRSSLDFKTVLILSDSDLILPGFTERLNMLMLKTRVPELSTKDDHLKDALHLCSSQFPTVFSHNSSPGGINIIVICD
jgi:hypothetical protein